MVQQETSRMHKPALQHGAHQKPVNKNMSLASRGNSFMYAFNGLKLLLPEPNIVLHAIATVAVIALGLARDVGPAQWVALLLAIVIVWISEALNTCIEKLCDYACGNKLDTVIGHIKDIAAGAVLIASIASAAIGIIVFFFWN